MQNKSNEIVEGTKYFNLTLTGNVSFRDTKNGKRMYVEAKCDCGVIKSYPLRYLKTGNTKSCGCVRAEKLLAASVTHNLTNNPLYSVYQDMKRRCYEPKCRAYKDYGARGILVDEIWLNDIHSFIEWGELNGFKKGLQLDRKDNDKGYSPNNCRFVTQQVNTANTRRVLKVTAFGETKCVAEWTRDERCQVSPQTLKSRLMNGKWDVDEAITTPSHGKTKELAREKTSTVIVKAFGEEKSIIGWSEDSRCKISYSGLKRRLQKGWNAERAISTDVTGIIPLPAHIH